MRLDHLLLSNDELCFTGVRTSFLHSENATIVARVSAWSGGVGVSRVDGALAQLGEHLLCKQGVVGSIPTSSTTPGKTFGSVAQVVRAHP